MNHLQKKIYKQGLDKKLNETKKYFINRQNKNINDKEWNDLFLEFELDNSLDEFDNNIQQLEKEKGKKENK